MQLVYDNTCGLYGTLMMHLSSSSWYAFSVTNKRSFNRVLMIIIMYILKREREEGLAALKFRVFHPEEIEYSTLSYTLGSSLPSIFFFCCPYVRLPTYNVCTEEKCVYLMRIKPACWSICLMLGRTWWCCRSCLASPLFLFPFFFIPAGRGGCLRQMLRHSV